MELVEKMRYWNTPRHPSRYVGVAVTLLLHAAVVIALLQYKPVRSALTQVMPIMVSLITPPKMETPPEPPKPRPVRPRVLPKPIEPPPLITAASEAPAPYVAPAPTPRELPPIIPPSFNADYLDNPPPPYPPLSRRMGEQGKVILRVLVNANGTADRVVIKSSSGSTRLDGTALETVKRWRFVPARRGDQPVAAWVLIPISFTLEG